MGGVARVNRPGVAWTQIRNAAVDAARRGWPVVPGEPFLANSDCALCPINADWRDAPITDPGRALAVWTAHPYALLLVCGHGVDVLEVSPAVAGLLPVLAGRGVEVPVAVVAPFPRRLLYVATGSALLPELAAEGTTLHALGGYVALPPTTLGQRSARWLRPPPDHGTALPGSDEVQLLLVDALRAGRRGGDGD